MPIRVLEPAVAAQIAAGEVVERPASVVKELLENAIDAAAGRIAVEIWGGGAERLRVVDDGHGIPAAEVPLAFHRHATSKLTAAEQLDAIGTLGFRGEALPSIAAVSQTAITTRPPTEDAGFRLELHWGEAVDSGRQGCAPGTAIEVRDLFGNLPARRKFLRSAGAEAARIQELVTRYALAFPAIRFQLSSQGRAVFSSSGSGQPREALAAVYGATAAAQMLEVQAADPDTGYSIEGFISAPSLSRASRTYLTFFVNRRLIQNRMLAFAVEEAYAGLLQVKRYPLAALNIGMPYADVDVNSHPAKREVRFLHDNAVFAAVQRAVRAALVAESPVPEVAAPTGESGRGRLYGNPRPSGGVSGLAPGGLSRPASGPAANPYIATAGATAGETGEMPDAAPDDSGFPLPGSGLLSRPMTPLKVVGQLRQTYIVAEGDAGMYLIDQHAAHERVLFERIRRQLQERQPLSQPLLTPASIELTPAQAETLDAGWEWVTGYGFAVEPFGGGYLLRAVPAILSGAAPETALADILDLAALQGPAARRREDIMAASIACHASVRAGQPLAAPEMTALLEQLEQAPNPHTCPHGRPTMIHFSSYLMEREFGRR